MTPLRPVPPLVNRTQSSADAAIIGWPLVIVTDFGKSPREPWPLRVALVQMDCYSRQASTGSGSGS
jgi:hypothetical protein